MACHFPDEELLRVNIHDFHKESPGIIPKIIHQTWKDEDVPENWKPSSLAWQKHHPDWEYHLWTDKELCAFLLQKFPDFYNNTYKVFYVQHPTCGRGASLHSLHFRRALLRPGYCSQSVVRPDP